jgi:hypothetical protein
LGGVSKEVVETAIELGASSITEEVANKLKSKPWYKYYRDHLELITAPGDFDPASNENTFKNELRVYVRRLMTSTSLKRKDKNNEIALGD